ncbi:MAG: hypothetical protein PHC43_00845 [Candidatus Marinimicrobia bacterium]|jgi:hypothetical protein|nr:hypothetical protein [Candidatus Neomarinimicrobiota bacterium]MDD5229855.1 hypothetical protein [Candidatus Neomarinimicrobiota bacterium]MDD5539499.1 hypothetical protein [Candidatus Neomarinimicrobiota bacterium]
MWTKILFFVKLIAGIQWWKIGKETKEAIAAIKAIKLDGQTDRAEIETAVKEFLDLVEVVFPNAKIIIDHLRGK